MTITMKSRYAVRALIELAKQESLAPGRPTQLALIAQRRDIPLQFLEQLLASLRRAGVVCSRRGARGGYLFARPPHTVSVLEVVAVLDGPIVTADCVREQCARRPACGAATVWDDLQRAVEEVLGGTTIGELAERELQAAERCETYSI